MTEEKEDYSPYCKLCTACGEDGCCSHLACFATLIENPECEYGKTYLRDARYADKMANLGSNIIEKLKNKLITAEEAVAEYDKGFHQIYDVVYGKETNVSE
jgi:hypothetical protein